MRTIDKQQQAKESLLNFAGTVPTAGGLSYLAASTANPLLFLGNVGLIGSNLAGVVAGAAGDLPTEKELDEYNKSALPALIPGVANYRMARRALMDAKSSKHPRTNILSESIGSFLPMTLGTGVGALIGVKTGGHTNMSGKMLDGATGAFVGTLIGSVPLLVGAALANIRRRTKQQQKEHDDKLNLMNYFVPGVASYNAAQRAFNS